MQSIQVNRATPQPRLMHMVAVGFHELKQAFRRWHLASQKPVKCPLKRWRSEPVFRISLQLSKMWSFYGQLGFQTLYTQVWKAGNWLRIPIIHNCRLAPGIQKLYWAKWLQTHTHILSVEKLLFTLHSLHRLQCLSVHDSAILFFCNSPPRVGLLPGECRTLGMTFLH